MTDKPTPTADTRDLATIIAISIVAFSIANFLHEAVGHGGACVLTGGHARVLSTVHFECDHDTRFISAAGTLVNIITAFFSWIALRTVNRTHHYLRFFLWLLMTINSLGAAGYFLFSGVGNIGDWADVIQGMEPAWLWHVALTLVGGVSYTLLVWHSLLELRPFLGDRDWRHGGAKDLTIVPYLTGGTLYTVAGLFNPVGMILVGISAAASSFGGSSGMAWMTQCLGTKLVPKIPSEPFTLPRSRAWIIVAAITAAIFIGVLGRGVRF
jgi:hypothetical protein